MKIWIFSENNEKEKTFEELELECYGLNLYYE